MTPDEAVEAWWKKWACDLSSYSCALGPHVEWAKEENERQKDLYKLLEEVRVIATLLYPVMPHASLEVLKKLELAEKDVSAKNLKWGYLKEGTKLIKGNILFQKIEVKK